MCVWVWVWVNAQVCVCVCVCVSVSQSVSQSMCMWSLVIENSLNVCLSVCSGSHLIRSVSEQARTRFSEMECDW
jgi:hypothetical protein